MLLSSVWGLHYWVCVMKSSDQKGAWSKQTSIGGHHYWVDGSAAIASGKHPIEPNFLYFLSPAGLAVKVGTNCITTRIPLFLSLLYIFSQYQFAFALSSRRRLRPDHNGRCGGRQMIRLHTLTTKSRMIERHEFIVSFWPILITTNFNKFYCFNDGVMLKGHAQV